MSMNQFILTSESDITVTEFTELLNNCPHLSNITRHDFMNHRMPVTQFECNAQFGLFDSEICTLTIDTQDYNGETIIISVAIECADDNRILDLPSVFKPLLNINWFKGSLNINNPIVIPIRGW